MQDAELESRLNQISTRWTMIREAHGDDTDFATAKRTELMERYGSAAYRYLFAE